MTCEICGRESLQDKKLCEYHDLALENLRTTYEFWQKASKTDWDGYLDALLELEETGLWVREVIEHLKSLDDPEALMSVPS
ncbi:hypothetical protein EU545_03540 [Candidatus Thorarchaeota archaeon]|nr:MAG: hypothetical protein EU545_03540 [Candidatus Thorarchaeota archaeon]